MKTASRPSLNARICGETSASNASRRRCPPERCSCARPAAFTRDTSRLHPGVLRRLPLFDNQTLVTTERGRYRVGAPGKEDLRAIARPAMFPTSPRPFRASDRPVRRPGASPRPGSVSLDRDERQRPSIGEMRGRKRCPIRSAARPSIRRTGIAPRMPPHPTPAPAIRPNTSAAIAYHITGMRCFFVATSAAAVVPLSPPESASRLNARSLAD